MMVNLGDRRRRLVRGLALAGVAAAGYVFGITSDRAAAQSGPPVQPPAGVQPGGAVRTGTGTPAQPEPDRRVVAYVYGNTPITREELGEFLIARGGHEKLELLVNKRIIEIEAARRNVTVTMVEIQSGLEEDLRGLGINRADFEKHVLPRYNKSLYEWIEDVIKPRLLLSKMCRDRVKVAETDIQKVFENRYGERRDAKIICWGKADEKIALKQWDEARKSDADFDRIARTQADANLAAAGGRVKPIGRYSETGDETVVAELYKLNVGEISGVIQVQAGYMCIKYVGPVAADANAKLDDAMKAALHKELFAKKLEQEIPKCFQELKALATPNLLMTKGPSAAEFREGVNETIKQTGGVPKPSLPPPVLTTPRP